MVNLSSATFGSEKNEKVVKNSEEQWRTVKSIEEHRRAPRNSPKNWTRSCFSLFKHPLSHATDLRHQFSRLLISKIWPPLLLISPFVKDDRCSSSGLLDSSRTFKCLPHNAVARSSKRNQKNNEKNQRNKRLANFWIRPGDCFLWNFWKNRRKFAALYFRHQRDWRLPT